jgi:L-histidine Nalpha-methyltransferase
MIDAELTEIEALRARLLRPLPEIPCKYLYDDRGNALFEEITRLPEYYPTRTEERLLEERAEEIVRRVMPRELAELGSGTGRKIRMLLDAMGALGIRERCVLLDINEALLGDSVARLSREYPDLDVRGVAGDFEHDLARLGPGGRRLVLLLAGTIGNLPHEEAGDFVRAVARQMAPGDAFLVGFDLEKDVARLEAAYDDAQGVTAAFNKNVLRVLDRRFDADFDPDGFDHVARWVPELHRIEMRLRARRAMRVHVRAAGVTLDLEPGDDLLTEVSCKYTRPAAARLAEAGGLRLGGWWTDADSLFALGLLRTP